MIIELHNPFDQGYFNSEELSRFGFKCVGENVRVAKNSTIIGLKNISLGSNVRIDGGVVISASSGYLLMGDYIHIGGGSYLGCAGGVSMNDFSGLSQGVRIYSGTDDYSGDYLTNPTVPSQYLNVKIAPVILGKHVIVGSGSVILPGVTLDDGVSIGALSLINKSLESWSIFSGIPVKKMKARSKNLLNLEEELRRNLS